MKPKEIEEYYNKLLYAMFNRNIMFKAIVNTNDDNSLTVLIYIEENLEGVQKVSSNQSKSYYCSILEEILTEQIIRRTISYAKNFI